MSFSLIKAPDTVVLRNPDNGDVRRITLNDIRRFTRSGTLRYGADDTHWTQVNTYVYKFSKITNVYDDYIIDQLKDFLKDNAGLEITWTDHLGVTRTGYILTPVNEIVSERPDCSFSVNFEIMEKPV